MLKLFKILAKPITVPLGMAQTGAESLFMKILMGQIRTFVVATAGILVANGYLDMSDQEKVVGALMVLIVAIASGVDKWIKHSVDAE